MKCYFHKQIFKVFDFVAKNTVISPNFLVRKFCGKAQFLHSFGQIAQNYAETVPFQGDITLFFAVFAADDNFFLYSERFSYC